jgi:agmatine deiminase
MKKIFLLVGVLIVSGMFIPVRGQVPVKKYTHWLSPEDKLHLGDIGKGFVQTDPPSSPVRNVAEFDRMQGVLVSYPFGIPMALIKEMANDVMVTTIVANTSQQNTVLQQYQNAGVNTDHCNFLIAPSDSYWTRDYGPWFESDSLNRIGIVDFPYNRPRPNDDNIPVRLAAMLGVPWYGMDVSHTGGNYMTDGMGISSSTDLVWTENGSQTHGQIAQKVHDYLGINNYMVVPDPNGTYIDHIDCWGKFLAPDKILIRRVPPTHSQYSAIEATAAYYASQTCSYGYNYRVFRVDTPDDQPYSNSLILNNKVFVPFMNSAWDDSALASYAAAMPGYSIFGVAGLPAEPWVSTDALHCRTMGIADLGQLYIRHVPLSGNVPAQDNFRIGADLVRCSDSAAYSDSVLIWYKVNNGGYNLSHMSRITGDHYEGLIPKQTPGSVIRYYLYAADKSGRHATAPFIGPADPFTFTAVYTDLTTVPDTLKFMTLDDLNSGRTFYIHNYTPSAINLTELPPNGYFTSGPFIGWMLDPYPVASLPYPVNTGDSLGCRVRILLPLGKDPEGYYTSTLVFSSPLGSHSVFIMVNDSLWSGQKEISLSQGNVEMALSPNPFREKTLITLFLNENSRLRLEIFDQAGRSVRTLAQGNCLAGTQTFTWDGISESGRRVPAGLYLCRVITDKTILTRRLLLIR